MEYIGACGAVLYHKTNGVYKYLIIKNKDNQYEFPKGEPDDSNDYYNSTNKMIKEKLGLNLSYVYYLQQFKQRRYNIY